MLSSVYLMFLYCMPILGTPTFLLSCVNCLQHLYKICNSHLESIHHLIYLCIFICCNLIMKFWNYAFTSQNFLKFPHSQTFYTSFKAQQKNSLKMWYLFMYVIFMCLVEPINWMFLFPISVVCIYCWLCFAGVSRDLCRDLWICQ